ncbi:DUF1254 domain-containing protein [Metapseudomonas sp. CR1201]
MTMRAPLRPIFALALIAALPPVLRAEESATPPVHPGFAFEASNFPSAATSQRLYDELDYQRAVQAYIWGQPLVGLAAIAEGARRIGIQPNELFVFDQGLKVNQALQTGNDDVIYSFSYFNLKDSGPLIVEIPKGNQSGVLLDAWQRPIEDVGRIGPDRGEGGKYLIVPPGYTGALPDEGYIIRNAATFNGLLFLRAVRTPRQTQESAVERLAQSNLYPYAQHASPPPLRMRKMGLDDYDGLTPKGLDYFELLALRVREEVGEERDRIMLDMLASLGIESGRPFTPDARMQRTLDEAERTGRVMVANLEINPRNPRRAIFPGTQWRNGTGMTHYTQERGSVTELDERAALFRFGFGMHKFLAPGFKPVPGKGAAYAIAYRDGQNRYLVGDKTYRLHVPAAVPVADYWSITAYDADSFNFVDNRQERPSLSSLQDLARNADGSIDLYFGPQAPAGEDSNWIQTIPGKGFLLLLRLFGPTQPFHDGSWVLGDASAIPASELASSQD